MSNLSAVLRQVVPIQDAVGDDDEDTRLIRELGDQAKAYCLSFRWCESVRKVYFGDGIGGIFCVFLLEIVSSRKDVGDWIWVVMGDVPPAYLHLDDCDSPKEVFDVYMSGMMNWVRFALEGKAGTADDGVPPLEFSATPENARMLLQRLKTLENLIKPVFHSRIH